MPIHLRLSEAHFTRDLGPDVSTMGDIAKQRIQREFKEVVKSEEVKSSGVHLDLVGDSFSELVGTIAGPQDSPYQDGVFKLEIKIPDSYPFNPPKVRFVTKIWHPNISSVTGAICLDILKDQWAAAMTLRTVLLSLQALLTAPEPDDPQDAVVARQYISNFEMFKATARHWAAVHAGASFSHPDFDSKMRKLVEMGVEEEAAYR